jgi:hypothetical protein
MCQAIADGGTRCDFHNPATVALMEMLVKTTHATEDDVKASWKELKAEGKQKTYSGINNDSSHNWQKFLQDQKLAVSSNPFLMRKEKEKLLTKLDKSSDYNSVSESGLHALQNLSDHVKSKRNAKLMPNLNNATPSVLTGEVSYENWPLPQADNLDKIATVVDAIEGGATTSDSIGESIDTVDRQGSYYANAAGYLGLVEKSKDDIGVTQYSLTIAGQQFLASDEKERTVMLSQMIEQTPLMQSYRETGGDKSKLEKTIVENGLENSVAKRRAASIVTWSEKLKNVSSLTSEISSSRQETITRAIAASQKQNIVREAKKQELFATVVKQNGKICTNCFMAMPLSGICDNC